MTEYLGHMKPIEWTSNAEEFNNAKEFWAVSHNKHAVDWREYAQVKTYINRLHYELGGYKARVNDPDVRHIYIKRMF